MRAILLLTFMLSCFVVASSKVLAPTEYLLWLEDLKQEMLSKGISAKTLDKAFAKNYYNPKSEVVAKDRSQPEFVLTATDYLNRTVTAERVNTARKKYVELYPLFKDMEQKYGVPFNYIVAFWGMETNFGQHFGKYEIIGALTELSYDKRRSKFFRKELFEALKIIDANHIEPEQMLGSWAGAMGHFQFMPSTFNHYAQDYDGNGKIDLWHSFEDAAASASNYLSQIGWKKNEPWGVEVRLPWSFDYALTGRDKTKTLAEWKGLGVKFKHKKHLQLSDNIKAALIIPEGKKGKAYLVFANFNKIMSWNHTENYGLGIGLLADYIVSEKPFKAQKTGKGHKMKIKDIVAIQKFINKLGLDTVETDGKLGQKTREAIKKVQKEAKLPQDGYPDYQLLNKINHYNPQVGFVVPVQPRKLYK